MVQLFRFEVLLALLAFLGIGLSDFIRKRGVSLGGSPVGYLFVETLVFLAVIGVLMYFLEGGRVVIDSATLTYAPLSAVAISLGIAAMLYGLKVGEASVVIPIARLGLAIPVLLGIIILREALTPTKAAGLILAVISVYLLSR